MNKLIWAIFTAAYSLVYTSILVIWQLLGLIWYYVQVGTKAYFKWVVFTATDFSQLLYTMVELLLYRMWFVL